MLDYYRDATFRGTAEIFRCFSGENTMNACHSQ
jgi:hypothetical protein